MRIVRVLRGILRAAITWIVLWVPVSLLPLGLAIASGSPFPAGALRAFLVAQTVVGAINGTVFASVLAITGRRRTFESLRMPWMAACGAVGGAAGTIAIATIMLSRGGIAIPASAFVGTLVTNAVLGAGLSALTLSVARRAPALSQETGAALPAPDTGAA